MFDRISVLALTNPRIFIEKHKKKSDFVYKIYKT